MATLSIVSTPIGNLEDITLRALKALSSADLILCEDTRVTKKLLDRHGIRAKTMSYHARSSISRTDDAVRLLREGKSLALVSDAGTPGISDPGAELVGRVRSALAAEVADGSLKIVAVPGPSALTAALSIAGVPCAEFTFLGFLPHKKGRETLFREIAASARTMVFYESPHRITKALASLSSASGMEGKRVTVCRELTKVFEETFSGTAAEAGAFFGSHPEKVRGEFVVIVSEARSDI